MDTDRRIADLTNKISARDGKPGYKRNVEAMRTELLRLNKAKAQKSASSSPAVESQESALTDEAPAE